MNTQDPNPFQPVTGKHLARVEQGLCKVCKNWARTGGPPYLFKLPRGIVTEHHPNCPHYNDSLIDVWMVSVDGNAYFTQCEKSARQEAEDSEIPAKVEKVKIHREVLEQLPEFDGF